MSRLCHSTDGAQRANFFNNRGQTFRRAAFTPLQRTKSKEARELFIVSENLDTEAA